MEYVTEKLTEVACLYYTMLILSAETVEAGNCVHRTYLLKIEQPAELVMYKANVQFNFRQM